MAADNIEGDSPNYWLGEADPAQRKLPPLTDANADEHGHFTDEDWRFLEAAGKDVRQGPLRRTIRKYPLTFVGGAASIALVALIAETYSSSPSTTSCGHKQQPAFANAKRQLPNDTDPNTGASENPVDRKIRDYCDGIITHDQLRAAVREALDDYYDR